MKAIVVRQTGGLEAMNMESVPDPTPADKDVVVQVEACGVCMHDVAVRNGTLKRGVQLPTILGHEISGTVVAVGSKVRRFRVGQRVATVQRYHICGACRFCRGSREPLCEERKFLGDWGMVGGYAEYVAIEDDNLADVPDGLPLAEMAIAACAMGTILNAVRDVGKLQVGESVLVTGAGGGLGLHALQIANAFGAQVIAQTTSPDKAAFMKSVGAHEVVVHGRGEDFSQQVLALTAGRGVDMVIDNVGTPQFQPTRKSLAVLGRWLMIGQLTGEFVPFNPAQLFLRGQSMLAVTSTTRAQLEDVLKLVQMGKIKPVVDRSFSLAEAREAHRQVEAGSVRGRALIRPQA